MKQQNAFRIAVFEGDGIGPEVMAPCLTLLDAAVARTGGITLRYETLPAGAGCYLECGNALPQASVDAAAAADAMLLSATGLPDVRYPDGTEIVPQIELRSIFGLYAGVRPIRPIPGVPVPLADPRMANLDAVIVRESIEGLFASRGKGTVEGDAVARETLEITRTVSEKLFDHSFALASQRKQRGGMGRVTCVDKANVFSAFAFFRKIFDERAAAFPGITADHIYVDAMAMKMVRNPWDYDVLVMENMFGDILSDLGAGLIGGLGFAPSADLGDTHGLFQPCHGTAPDIAGKGLANPTAMFLSAAMMLDWLGERTANPSCTDAAQLIRTAVDRAYATHELIPFELGGDAGTGRIADAVLGEMLQV